MRGGTQGARERAWAALGEAGARDAPVGVITPGAVVWTGPSPSRPTGILADHLDGRRWSIPALCGR